MDKKSPLAGNAKELRWNHFKISFQFYSFIVYMLRII
jgi:hypothetical protein